MKLAEGTEGTEGADQLLQAAKAKAMRYCAYQERAPAEVKQKLLGLGLDPGQVNTLIEYLVHEGFIHEERFATMFAGGRFRLKKWGKDKIRLALQQKGIAAHYVDAALNSIDANAYLACLDELYHHKKAQVAGLPPLQAKIKLFNFLRGKGYEAELVHQVLQKNGHH